MRISLAVGLVVSALAGFVGLAQAQPTERLAACAREIGFDWTQPQSLARAEPFLNMCLTGGACACPTAVAGMSTPSTPAGTTTRPPGTVPAPSAAPRPVATPAPAPRGPSVDEQGREVIATIPVAPAAVPAPAPAAAPATAPATPEPAAPYTPVPYSPTAVPASAPASVQRFPPDRIVACAWEARLDAIHAESMAQASAILTICAAAGPCACPAAAAGLAPTGSPPAVAGSGRTDDRGYEVIATIPVEPVPAPAPAPAATTPPRPASTAAARPGDITRPPLPRIPPRAVEVAAQPEPAARAPDPTVAASVAAGVPAQTVEEFAVRDFDVEVIYEDTARVTVVPAPATQPAPAETAARPSPAEDAALALSTMPAAWGIGRAPAASFGNPAGAVAGRAARDVLEMTVAPPASADSFMNWQGHKLRIADLTAAGPSRVRADLFIPAAWASGTDTDHERVGLWATMLPDAVVRSAYTADLDLFMAYFGNEHPRAIYPAISFTNAGGPGRFEVSDERFGWIDLTGSSDLIRYDSWNTLQIDTNGSAVQYRLNGRVIYTWNRLPHLTHSDAYVDGPIDRFFEIHLMARNNGTTTVTSHWSDFRYSAQ